MRRRIAVGIEYDGSGYSGWQVQSTASSVQQVLQSALGRIADHPVELICAGRTDAGVHAHGQVAHFDTPIWRSPRAWLLGANHFLPDDISVNWVCVVPDHFHARYSAFARSYRYLILNRSARSAMASRRALLLHRPLEVALMREASRCLIGEHDFSAFRSSECQARTAVREVISVQVERRGDWVTIEVTANAFLHHMVRNMVGLLLAVGQQRVPPARAQEQLASRRRSEGEAMAPALGLYLWRVDYAPQFGLPAVPAMIDGAILGGP